MSSENGDVSEKERSEESYAFSGPVAEVDDTEDGRQETASLNDPVVVNTDESKDSNIDDGTSGIKDRQECKTCPSLAGDSAIDAHNDGFCQVDDSPEVEMQSTESESKTSTAETKSTTSNENVFESNLERMECDTASGGTDVNVMTKEHVDSSCKSELNPSVVEQCDSETETSTMDAAIHSETVTTRMEIVEGGADQENLPTEHDDNEEASYVEITGDKNITNELTAIASACEVSPDPSTSDVGEKLCPAPGAAAALGHLDDKGSIAEASGNSVKPSTQSSLDSVYYLKWFQWRGVQTPLVTQNENGPCPLLAIANVLMLSHKIQIPTMQEFITAQQLMEYIGDYILSLTPKENNDEGFILNYEQNMQDAIAIMHKLQTGIDVNVKFTGPTDPQLPLEEVKVFKIVKRGCIREVGQVISWCTDFEFTSECVVFDLLHIGLYHGWLVDPQDFGTVKAIGSLSYNQIVEKIIASKEVNTSADGASEGIVAENFLEQTASQLTYHGLCELSSFIAPSELCVFFRNNHFSTLYKHKDKLFLLVTDQGYLTEPRIIWETLSNVEGDGEFVNADFNVVGPIQTYASNPSTENPQGMSQEDRDYLVALSLQDKTSDSSRSTPSWGMSAEEAMRQEAAEQERNDRLLALRLQEQERQLIAQQQQQQQRQQRPVDPRLAQHGRGYPQDSPRYHDNRVRVPNQGHVVSDEDRHQQGKCSIL